MIVDAAKLRIGYFLLRFQEHGRCYCCKVPATHICTLQQEKSAELERLES
jgi:hypothetical protein